MKYITLLPVAAGVVTAFVVPDESMSAQFVLESEKEIDSIWDKLPSKDQVLSDIDASLFNVFKTSKNALDDVLSALPFSGSKKSAPTKSHFRSMESMTAFDTSSWLEEMSQTDVTAEFSPSEPVGPSRPCHEESTEVEEEDDSNEDEMDYSDRWSDEAPGSFPEDGGYPEDEDEHHGPPHHGPPRRGPPSRGRPPHGAPRRGRAPHGPPPHGGPRRGSPPHGPPRRGPPRRGPPSHGPPRKGAPRPGHGPPPPHHGPPQHGPPPHGPPPPPHHGLPHRGPPPHGPPHGGPAHHEKPPHHKKPHHKKPHHGHRPHHGHKSNLTVYQLISNSKYTTKLAKLIDEFDDIVDFLNSTKANVTIFAPTNKAFAKIPKDGKKPPKELIEKVLKYHVVPGLYPAGRVFLSHTIPTALEEPALGNNSQRLRIGVGLHGLSVNFFSKVVAVNIFGTNGIIHGVDSIILPPPPALKIIDLLPSEFSTLSLALAKTGLGEVIIKSNHTGGTLFAPTNFAFKKLGPKINAFLFSKFGEKYLKALLEYHIVANQTLYSDALVSTDATEEANRPHPKAPKWSLYHYHLPTLLGKPLVIDVSRWGRFISIKINAINRVAVQDGIAKDGVIQLLSSVLIPPKPGHKSLPDSSEEPELTVEELKERLDSFEVPSDEPEVPTGREEL